MDSCKQKQQKENISYNLQENISLAVQPQSVSPYKQKYSQYFSQFEMFDINDYQDQLTKNKIKYSKQNFHPGYIIQIPSRTQKSSIITLTINFSYFQFEITILNIDGESPGKGEGSQKSQRSQKIGLLQQLNQGGYGQILLSIGLQQKYFVIKSIQYIHKNQKYQKRYHQNLIQNTIIEYCYYKLFSVLEVGPHIENYLGFDLIVYNSTIQFAMQQCTHSKSININHLKNNLHIMHSLNIIHGDIKPDNIMYSQENKKFVFVDFGFSKCLQGKPGTMTTSRYFGTWIYSCQEMLEAFQKGVCLLDLYYNDVYG